MAPALETPVSATPIFQEIACAVGKGGTTEQSFVRAADTPCPSGSEESILLQSFWEFWDSERSPGPKLLSVFCGDDRGRIFEPSLYLLRSRFVSIIRCLEQFRRARGAGHCLNRDESPLELYHLFHILGLFLRHDDVNVIARKNMSRLFHL